MLTKTRTHTQRVVYRVGQQNVFAFVALCCARAPRLVICAALRFISPVTNILNGSCSLSCLLHGDFLADLFSFVEAVPFDPCAVFER